ncbi:hypothetical protein Tco_0378825, partial [Tanacetum coccineum]
NGVNILKSIDEGLFHMGTFSETLAEGDEGALHLGPERPRVYSDLSPEDKDIMQLNSKFVNNMLPEWGRFVTAVKLNKGLRDSNYDQLTSSNPRNQAIVQDGRVVVQNVQGRQNRGQGNNARGAGTVGYEGALNRVGNANPGGQDNAVDEDVDEQPVQDLALNVDNLFQADDCDAFDSDVDEARMA